VGFYRSYRYFFFLLKKNVFDISFATFSMLSLRLILLLKSFGGYFLGEFYVTDIRTPRGKIL